MRNSIVALGISSVFLCIGSLRAQDNKYTRKNKNAPVITYSMEKCYSRSILVKDSIVYTANSNGSLMATDLRTGSHKNLLENRKFEEMRDAEWCGEELIGMQSGSYGVLARTNGSAFLDYVIPGDLWIGTFLDGMDFNGNTGFIMGDPKNGVFSLYYSEDCGRSWKLCDSLPTAYEGEAGFAASGTNVQVLNDSTFIFVSGGKKSRYFRSNDKGKSWKITSIPYMTSESSGAFSICMISDQIGVIVGGDYLNPDLCLNTCFYTDDGGEFWINAEEQTRGYRSCVIEAKGVFYSCGTNGVDYSLDNGVTWKPFAHGNFFSMTADEDSLYVTIPGGSFQIFELIQHH